MLKKRLIAVLILKDGQVVQSVRFRHTNIIHSNAVHAIEAFNKWSVDEIVMLNVTRSGDSQAGFVAAVGEVADHCFVPLTAGGWITDESRAQELLRNGADKIVVNTIVADDPDLVKRLSRRFGRQCIVASIDFARVDSIGLRVMVDRGSRNVGVHPVDWALWAQDLGAGEILLNSIDHDGVRKGYDLETLRAVSDAVDIPVIAFGGVFTWDHLVEGVHAGADAVAAANIFHYTEHSIKKAKAFLIDAGIDVRPEGRLGE